MERELKEFRGDIATTSFYTGIMFGVVILTCFVKAVESTNEDMRVVIDVIIVASMALIYTASYAIIPRLMEWGEQRIIQKNHSLPLKAPLLLSSRSDPSSFKTTTTSN
jgi:hypothetical protein